MYNLIWKAVDEQLVERFSSLENYLAICEYSLNSASIIAMINLWCPQTVFCEKKLLEISSFI